MKFFVLIFGLIYSELISSQNITGIWRGFFFERVVKGNRNLNNENEQKYNFEVQINQHEGGQIDGVTYSYKSKRFYGKASFKGSFDINLKKVLIVEQNMLDAKVDDKSDICTMSCTLSYIKENGKVYLKGTFISKNNKRKIECSAGDVQLEMVGNSMFKKESFLENKKVLPPINEKMKITTSDKFYDRSGIDLIVKDIQIQDSSNIIDSLFKIDSVFNKSTPVLSNFIIDERLKRLTNLLNTITVNVNEVLIEYYDNGIIDNDTITVYQNNQVVINKGRVSTKPLTLKLNVDSLHNTQEIVTIADNLGDIPPNTALMVVTVGDNRYEIPISIDDKKNAKKKKAPQQQLPQDMNQY